MTRRTLVVGASGLVGAELYRAAARRGDEVLGVARRLQGHATQTLDLTNRVAVERALRDFAPDVVWVCSAYPHVDGCEQDPERSHRENVDALRNLLGTGVPRPMRVHFFSTDHVFDGARRAYAESDSVSPLNVYARHKREAEQLLLARGNALVIRTSWVFGPEAQKKNFVYQVIAKSRSGETIRVPLGQAGAPTSTTWLVETALELEEQGMTGIVHLSGREVLTKGEWASVIVGALGLPSVPIEEVPWQAAGQVAPRPMRVELKSERHAFVQPHVADILARDRELLTQ